MHEVPSITAAFQPLYKTQPTVSCHPKSILQSVISNIHWLYYILAFSIPEQMAFSNNSYHSTAQRLVMDDGGKIHMGSRVSR